MLRLPQFEYHSPKSVAETVALLSEFKGEAKLLAGGTDLLVSMKHRVLKPRAVVNLNRVPGLSYIREEEMSQDTSTIRIGPLTTLREVANSLLIQQKLPVLAEASRSVGAETHQVMGTLGGNLCLDACCWYLNQSQNWRASLPGPCLKLGGSDCWAVKGSKVCHAVHCADTAPALFALGVEVRLQSVTGERTVPLKDFFTRDGISVNVLSPGEVLTEIVIHVRRSPQAGTYKKLRRRQAIDFPLLGVAAVMTTENGCIGSARVVLGAVDTYPVLIKEAETLLSGKALDDGLEGVIEEVSQAAYRRVRPIKNVLSHPRYRRKMAKVFTRQALQEIVARLRLF